MSMDDEQEEQRLSSIACEPCRQRKCKCDRVIPICASCSVSDPVRCEYKRGSKRGIPAGYLNSLESRLALTEAALYLALNEINGAQNEQYAYAEVSDLFKRRLISHKQETATEWRRLPLEERDDVHRWWLERRVSVLHQLSGFDVGSSAAARTSPTTSSHAETSSQSPPTSQPGSWVMIHGYSQPHGLQQPNLAEALVGIQQSPLSATLPGSGFQNLPTTTGGEASFWAQPQTSLVGPFQQVGYGTDSTAFQQQQAQHLLQQHDDEQGQQHQELQGTLPRQRHSRTSSSMQSHMYYQLP